MRTCCDRHRQNKKQKELKLTHLLKFKYVFTESLQTLMNRNKWKETAGFSYMVVYIVIYHAFVISNCAYSLLDRFLRLIPNQQMEHAFNSLREAQFGGSFTGNIHTGDIDICHICILLNCGREEYYSHTHSMKDEPFFRHNSPRLHLFK